MDPKVKRLVCVGFSNPPTISQVPYPKVKRLVRVGLSYPPPISQVPLELSLCTKLTDLMIQDNPLRMPFVDIEDLPLPDVLEAIDLLRLCHESVPATQHILSQIATVGS